MAKGQQKDRKWTIHEGDGVWKKGLGEDSRVKESSLFSNIQWFYSTMYDMTLKRMMMR